jgi:argonaute-like protein implicated in RNA metabolism and viral defense
MKKALLLGVIALLLGVSSETFAQGRSNRSDRQRVRRGIRTGQITRDEARILRQQQRQNRSERRVYRSDGTITRDERREIRRDERTHDRQIRRARRNNVGNSTYGRNHRRGNGYYRRGAGSRTHPVFGTSNRRRRN